MRTAVLESGDNVLSRYERVKNSLSHKDYEYLKSYISSELLMHLENNM